MNTTQTVEDNQPLEIKISMPYTIGNVKDDSILTLSNFYREKFLIFSSIDANFQSIIIVNIRFNGFIKIHIIAMNTLTIPKDILI